MMKKVLLLLVMLTQLKANADDKFLDSLTQDACECISGVDTSNVTKSELVNKFGICVIMKSMKYKESLKDYGIDVDYMDRETGRKLGQLVVKKMIGVCPETSMAVFGAVAKSGALDQPKPTVKLDRDFSYTKVGQMVKPGEVSQSITTSLTDTTKFERSFPAKVLSIDTTGKYVSFKMASTAGPRDTVDIVWMEKPSSNFDLAKEYLQLGEKKITIRFQEVKVFDFSSKKYITQRRLNSIVEEKEEK